MRRSIATTLPYILLYITAIKGFNCNGMYNHCCDGTIFMSSFSIPTSEDDLDGVYCCPGGPLTILAGASAAPNDCTSSTPILSIPTTSIDINIGGQDNTSTIGGTTVINSNGGIASATSVATPTERSSDSPASTNGAQGPNIPQWMMGAGAGLFLLPAL